MSRLGSGRTGSSWRDSGARADSPDRSSRRKSWEISGTSSRMFCLNSLIPFPRDPAISGTLFAPKRRAKMTRTINKCGRLGTSNTGVPREKKMLHAPSGKVRLGRSEPSVRDPGFQQRKPRIDRVRLSPTLASTAIVYVTVPPANAAASFLPRLGRPT